MKGIGGALGKAQQSGRPWALAGWHQVRAGSFAIETSHFYWDLSAGTCEHMDWVLPW